MQGSKKGPGNTEPVVVDPVPGDAPVADRGADDPRTAYPGTAAKNATIAVARCPSLPVARRPRIALVRAIHDPLPDISVHVVQTESICPEYTDGRRLPVVPLAAATAAVRLVATYVIAPCVARRRPGASYVLPL